MLQKHYKIIKFLLHFAYRIDKKSEDLYNNIEKIYEYIR